MKHSFTLALNRNEKILGWCYLLFELSILPGLIFYLGDRLEIASPALLNSIFYLINFVACVLIFHRFLLCSIKSLRKFPGKVAMTVIFGYMVYQISGVVLSQMISRFDPEFFNVNDASMTAVIEESPFVMLICVGFLVPVAEECLFRGLMFTPIYVKHPFSAYLTTALCFAVVHIIGYVGVYSPLTLMLCLLQYIPAGFILGWSLAETNTLITPILIHTLVNVLSILAMR